MKKIILYTMTLNRGGTEKTVCSLANYLCNKYEVTILTNILCESEYKINPKIKHICIDCKKQLNFFNKCINKLSFRRTFKLKEILKEENADIIISFLPEPSIRMLMIKSKIKRIVAIRNHPNSEFKFIKFIRNYFYKKADFIILQDSKYIKYFPKSFKEKMFIIPNYIIPSKNKPINKEKVISTASRLETQKNIKLLIKSFYEISSEYDDYILNIYGTGSKYKNLVKLIHKLKLDKKVFLKGNVSNIESLIKNSTLFILSSNYEGMPNALIEAMSLGVCCISTYSTEVISSIITNYENGIIVPIRNKNELSKSIKEVLENDNLRKKIENNAVKVNEKYNKDSIIKLWDDVIKKNC